MLKSKASLLLYNVDPCIDEDWDDRSKGEADSFDNCREDLEDVIVAVWTGVDETVADATVTVADCGAMEAGVTEAVASD